MYNNASVEDNSTPKIINHHDQTKAGFDLMNQVLYDPNDNNDYAEVLDSETNEEIEKFLKNNPRSYKLDSDEGISESDFEDNETGLDLGSKKSAYYVQNKSKKLNKPNKITDDDVEMALELKKIQEKNLNEEDFKIDDNFESSEEDDFIQSDPSENDDNPDTSVSNPLESLAEIVSSYQNMVEEVDSLWGPLANIIKEENSSEKLMPKPLIKYIKIIFHLKNLYIVNLSFALCLGSKEAVTSHPVSKRLQMIEQKIDEINSSLPENNDFVSICQQFLEDWQNDRVPQFKLTSINKNLDQDESKSDARIKKHAKIKPTNPRVLKRKKLDKKLSKWQSVVPKQRDTTKAYEGEHFGIRKNASRSIKFK